MKQKMVIKVQIHCQKCRTKAMKLVASAPGVRSIEVQGEYRDQLVVAGDGVDPVDLTCILRKKVGHAEVIKVEKTTEKPKAKEKKVQWWPNCPPPPSVIVHEPIHQCSDPCSIL